MTERFFPHAIVLSAVFAMGALSASAADMIIERPDGPVTTNEIGSFKAFMQIQPDEGDNNHNHWVYGNGGKNIEALGLVYEISRDREVLNQMIRFADAALAARNNPTNGRMIWTGKRELAWPNKPADSPDAASASSESGDVIGHIGYCAKLILQTPALWPDKVAIGDTNGFGANYHERALTYVREMDRSIDTFILPNFVSTTDSNHYRWPDTDKFGALGPRNQTGRGKPVPWNQHTMLSCGLLRLAECHEILGDDPARVKRFYDIVGANMDWFVGDLHPYERDGHTVYDWGYSLGRKSEDVPHGGYDIWGLCRAFESGKFNIPANTMTNFANTLRYVIYDSTNNTFAMRVDGRSPGTKAARNSIPASWTLLSQYFPNDDLYHLVVKSNLKPAKTAPLDDAFLLYLKHRRHLPSVATVKDISPK
jgi:hypothetical protein